MQQLKTPPRSLDEVVKELSRHKDRDWARENLLPTVLDLAGAVGAKTVMEIGAGRSPSFDRATIDRLGIRYIANDISLSELERGPDWVDRAHFDIVTSDAVPLGPFLGQVDLAFSRFVMEHVADYRIAYRNIHSLLSDGGISIAYHPVLYSLPFVLNFLMAERISRPVLRKLNPRRNDEEIPKFPAYYSGCFVSERVMKQLSQIGFRRVWQFPFYGHGYYDRLPVIRNLHRFMTPRLRDANVTALASFAFTIVMK